MIRLLVFCPLVAMAGDWPTWGGNNQRNMVNQTEKNMPITWDVESGTGIKWTADLGSQSYGNPVIYKGKILVGTNNEGLRDPEVAGDKGNVMCFSEADGSFLWQAIHDKLSAGRVNDWPLQGVCSTPFMDGDRAYYVSNRCELVCVDLEGFADGENDGPYTQEKYTGKQHADIVWVYDMIEELGVFPHNLATSSPALEDGVIYLVTGNGVDEGHLNLPSPRSPSFIAVDAKTGELKWEYGDLGTILHGQWSTPSFGVLGGKKQAVFPGGDGWVYALNPDDGKLLWKFDCNPKDSKWELGGFGTRNNLISTPVIFDNQVFIGVGQDPEHGTGIGHFYAIDGTKTGDVTATAAKWHRGNDDFGRTMSTAAIADGLLYITDLDGFLYCLDVKTGNLFWKHDLFSAVWGSPVIIDGKVYIGDEDGDVCILKHSKELKVLNEINMGSAVYTTPSAANGVLYIATRNKLFAITGG
ncbi:MAG: PQQ-binding-like beta-propeller repeat protein [Acidobacteria bacterium]|nr:PQQ-binding-like beta-propeller repeat protein [Acidobacteriota bacterium]